jgi:hypothetical protein
VSENSIRVGYKNQSVNAVWGNNRCLFSDSCRTRKYTVDVELTVLNAKTCGSYTNYCIKSQFVFNLFCYDFKSGFNKSFILDRT